MDPRFLAYYNRELEHVRKVGGEFAKEFPKIAGRLGLDEFECADPYVERLLEGFAFLAARIHLRIDAQFPRFTNHLLDVLHPNYLAPTPSFAVVRLAPNPDEGALAAGFAVPRGSILRSDIGRGEQTACEYRTAHEVTLWPVEVAQAQYSGFVGDLGDLALPSRRTARAALRIKLRATGGLKLDQTAIDRLPLFVRGEGERAMRLYEQLSVNAFATLARPGTSSPGPWQPVVVGAPVTPLGFEDDESLLPVGHRVFQGYRLLQEYFAMPARFMFVELGGLQAAARRCPASEMELVVLFDRVDATLENAVTAADLLLHCTPAANLFPRRADRIHITDLSTEHHVVPDRTRASDFEIYEIRDVVGFGSNADMRRRFRPMYATHDGETGAERESYYTVRREPRVLSERQRANGPRSSYVGSEVFVSLVDREEGPAGRDLKQLAVEALCTNRDLPLHMPIGHGTTDFTLESGAPVQSARCVAGPTPPRPSHAFGDTTWRLISHLSLNQLSLTGEGGRGASAMREMLSLYADLADAAVRRQVDGLVGVDSKPVTRRLPIPGPMAFARGLEVTLTFDEAAFHGTGAYLLGAVLDRFLARYASMNSFTETVMRTVQREEVARWPIRTGRRQVV